MPQLEPHKVAYALVQRPTLVALIEPISEDIPALKESNLVAQFDRDHWHPLTETGGTNQTGIASRKGVSAGEIDWYAQLITTLGKTQHGESVRCSITVANDQ